MKIGQERLTKVSQIGFVVKDLDHILKVMEERLGVVPVVSDLPETDARMYRGAPGDFKAKVAYYRFSDVELEFVQPTGGKSIWQDFLDAGHEGLHHIRFTIDDQKGTEADMKTCGFEIYQQGPSFAIPGCTWTYFDTEGVLPFFIETFNADEKRD